MGRGGRGAGAGDGRASALSDPFIIRGLQETGEAGADNNTALLQGTLDGAPDYANYLIQQEGTFYIEPPLRLLDKVGLSGLGRNTVLKCPATCYGGDLILAGAIQASMPHAAPILDDADFSYQFTSSSPAYFLKLGESLWPWGSRAWNGFFLETPIIIDSLVDGYFLAFCGTRGNINTIAMRFGWNGDFQRLNFVVRIGGANKTLTTTSTFHSSLGVARHMFGVDYDGTNLRLFVDGVIEHTVAATGTFEAEPWEEFNLGGGLGSEFPAVRPIVSSIDFRCGGLSLYNASKHTANYVVNWNKVVPSASVNQLLLLICEDEREQDDLIKLSMGGNGYGWLQVGRFPLLSALANGVTSVRKIQLEGGAGGMNTGIALVGTISNLVEDVYFGTAQAMRGVGNTYYSRFTDLSHVGNGRYGFHFSGGITQLAGLIKSSGCGIPFVISGSGSIKAVHAYDYTHIGMILDQWSGVCDTMGLSDEGTPVGVDPLFALMIMTFGGFASTLKVHTLGIDVLSSDTTIPIAIASPGVGVNQRVSLNGSCFAPGYTTPPAHLISFLNDTVTDPIYADLVNSYGCPISNHPEKVITSDGPAGRVQLTDANVTVTHRQARLFEVASSVTLTNNRALTLSGTLDPAAGCRMRVLFAALGEGFTYSVKNSVGTVLQVFYGGNAGSVDLVWDSTALEWVREAVNETKKTLATTFTIPLLNPGQTASVQVAAAGFDPALGVTCNTGGTAGGIVIAECYVEDASFIRVKVGNINQLLTLGPYAGTPVIFTQVR